MKLIICGNKFRLKNDSFLMANVYTETLIFFEKCIANWKHINILLLYAKYTVYISF